MYNLLRVLSVICASLLLVADAHSQDKRVPLELAREPGHELITTELAQALVSVNGVEARFFDLGLLDEKWLLPSDLSALQSNLELKEFLEASLQRFPFPEGASLDYMVDAIKHNAGYEAALHAFEQDPELKPDDLLKLISNEFLCSDPLFADERAAANHTVELEQLRLAPMTNGSAAYVVWGFLHLDSFWEGRQDQRVAFISDLLLAGMETPMTAQAARRVLQAPLSVESEKPGKTVALTFSKHRGKVGFVPGHERWLEQFLADLKEVQAFPGGEQYYDKFVLQLDKDGRLVGVSTNLQGHLLDWTAELLLWVRLELGSGAAAWRTRRGATLEERIAYWNRLASTESFARFREEMLAEIHAIMSWQDQHPLDARIRELLALDSLTDEEKAELKKLRKQVASDRDNLITHMIGLAVKVGAREEYGLVASTLLTDIPAAFGDMPQGHQEYLLRDGWGRLSRVPHRESLILLDQYLGGELKLPSYATDPLIHMAGAFKLDGYQGTLEGFLTQGNLRERTAALGNPDWLDAGRYAEEMSRLSSLSQDDEASRVDRIRARDGFLISLQFRHDESAKQLLLDAIEQGHFADASKANSWCHTPAANLDWVKAQLSGDEVKGLKETKLLDPSVF